MATDLTEQQAVLAFISKRGGVVTHMDLIDHFESVSDIDPSKKTRFRDRLDRHVDSLGFVKMEGGVKCVSLNEGSTNKGSMMRPEPGDRDGGDGGSGGEVKLRDRRRRESAPALGTDSVVLPCHVQVRGSRRISKGSQRAMLSSALSEDAGWEGLDLDGNTPKSSRRNFIELMMSSSPQVRRSLMNRGSRPRDSVRGDGDSTSLVSSADGDCVSVALDPLEHEWMMCASEGQWDRLHPQLILEPSLLVKRDFVTGFSCLHWAAKQGKEELLTQLLEHARQTNIPVDVNVRSSAGYTPLHLAAMHRHTQVMSVLVNEWSADPEARDYSGRRAVQYLPPGVSITATVEQGGGTSPVGRGDSDTENANSGAQVGRWRLPRVLQSNLNPLKLLNGPEELSETGAAGRSKAFQRKSSLSRINARLNRGRHKTQIVHSTSFRGTGEGGEISPTSPVKLRPMSNLFG
ncbi:hypothetical protein DPEC_G00048700 [Dallia pectoralis]|uniref:Uncharacterized protein n=1 Tax=Dallia pectoralis TaxID=75939 RepID=A0ACC2HB96_DALPE|nr:hypothetical protein DPEC_G00048700 [Dallia pectoralis]